MAKKMNRGGIEQRGPNSYRISFYDLNHVRQRELIKGTEEDAQRELAERLAEVKKGTQVFVKPSVLTFGALAAAIIQDYRMNHYTSIDDIDTRFRLHILPVFGNVRASLITTDHLIDYIVAREAEGAARNTIKRELEAMHRAFQKAFDSTPKKIQVIPAFPEYQADRVRTGFLERADVDRLASHLTSPYNKFVLFGFLTGWRYEEIQTLEWRNVNFTAGEIRIDVGADKNRSGRVVPMNQELRALLEELRREQKTKYPFATTVFTVVAKRRVEGQWVTGPGPVGAFKKQWKTACYKAGLPCETAPIKIRSKLQFDKKGKPKLRVIRAKHTFHDLRRSFARHMDQKGMRRGAIKQLAGWKTDSVFNRYNIVSDSDLRIEVDRIDSTGGRKTDVAD